jgi:GMP synthase-like glutamine amidotransferase
MRRWCRWVKLGMIRDFERSANQAFHCGADLYAFQFHLEVDEPLIDRPLGVPAHLRQIESLGKELDTHRIRRETRDRIAMHREVADRALRGRAPPRTRGTARPRAAVALT